MNLKPILIRPRGPLALGATLGQDLMAKVNPDLNSAEQEDCALILDLEETAAINASFLKATVFWAFRCGRAEACKERATSAEPWAIRPLRLFPMVSNCTGEVKEEVDEFFCGRGFPILNLGGKVADDPGSISILGTLDPVLERTLGLLNSTGEGTAADLAARSSDKITINGWNNRLADLHQLRLATRRREGKFWVYLPVKKEVAVWV